MKKLFLWTFVLTLLCTWMVVGADQAPNILTTSSQGPDLDREAIKAEKDKAAAMLMEKEEVAEPLTVGSGASQLQDVPAQLSVPEQVDHTLLGNADPFPAPEKPAYTGPKNVPDQNVILQGGDVCASATVIPSVPYNVDGTTIGYTDDYEESCFYSPSTSPDVVYSYTPEVDIQVTLSLCQGQTDYDTKLYIYEDVCQAYDDPADPYACNDDFCTGDYTYVSEIQCVWLYAGHTYYIVVDGYGGASGNYNLDISECVGCDVVCDPDAYYETEPICYDEYVDTYNGGCNSTPNVFEDIPWGPICGTSGTYLYQGGNYRDTDWFRVNVPSASVLSWTVEAEFDVLIFIIQANSGDCLDYAILGSITGPQCTPINLTFEVSAGDYWLWVGPSIFTGIPCGAEYAGTAELLGAITGACCIDEVCEFTSEEAECVNAGGLWYANETCPEFQCPSDVCADAIYHNGTPDWVNGYASDRRTDGSLEGWIADDVPFEFGAHVTDMHWWAVATTGYDWQNTDDYIVLLNDGAGGKPGTVLMEVWDVDNTRFDTGDLAFGYIVWLYSLYVDFVLPPGTYWMGMRSVNQGATGQAYHLTAPVTGMDCHFKSDYFGVPDWSPSFDQWGQHENAAFCITGDTEIPPGACCDDETGECIEDVPVEQCPPPLRFGAGMACAELEPPCGQVTGACCDPETGDCAEMLESDCANAGWDYQGDWTSCDPNPCPNPFCHDYSVTAPVAGETGSTCGMGNDCDLRTTEEVIYEVEIPADGDWYFSLCGSAYDTYLFVGTTCCGAEVGENDDFCGLQSQLNAVIEAGTYYVAIEGYSGCGDYVLNIWMEGGCDDFITVDIFTDEYPDETTWEVRERDTGVIVGSGGPLSDPLTQHSWEVCGDPNMCYEFEIFDLYGDGICCDWGDGHYEIYDFTGAMVCSGADFGYSELCPDIGQCEPPTGACCIDDICEFTSEQQPCLDAGGVWYIGEDCDAGFQCPIDPCAGAVWHNGEPPAYGAYASQCATDYPFQFAAADDFELTTQTLVTSVTMWFGHWNNDPLATPDNWTGATVTIYNDAAGIPDGYPIDGDPNCAMDETDFPYTRLYNVGEYSIVESAPDVWQGIFPIDEDLCLVAGSYWISVAPVMLFTGVGQCGPTPTTGVQGSVPLIWGPLLGYPEWGDAGWLNDMSFCIIGEDCGGDPTGACCDEGVTGDCQDGLTLAECTELQYARWEQDVACADLEPPCQGQPDCVYIAGDPNCNGVPAELPDVITMIGNYRGTVEHCYECECPPHGTFAPHADPNGNCVSDELPDVVGMIGIYRGTVDPADCDDCPGQGRIAPGGIIPSLKSKVKATQQSMD